MHQACCIVLSCRSAETVTYLPHHLLAVFLHPLNLPRYQQSAYTYVPCLSGEDTSNTVWSLQGENTPTMLLFSIPSHLCPNFSFSGGRALKSLKIIICFFLRNNKLFRLFVTDRKKTFKTDCYE